MGVISFALKSGAVLSLVLGLIIGAFLAGVPRQFGFYVWLVGPPSYGSMLFGLFPATLDGVPWGYSFEALSKANLAGQHAIVTGANSGVGYWTALHLARQGATVTMACRTDSKCTAAAAEIRANTTQGKVQTMTLDTSKLRSVRQFGAEFNKKHGHEALDMLFLNAGIASAGAAPDGSSVLSEDGIEMVFATNYVGHHLLYSLLAPLLQKSARARVVQTSSASNFDTFDFGVATDLKTLNSVSPEGGGKPYGQSKLAQVLWAQELTRQLGPDSNVYVNSYHPGMADTGIWGKNPMIPSMVKPLIQKMQRELMWTSEEGALTMLYLGVEAGQPGKHIRGKYFHPQAIEIAPNPKFCSDVALQKALWNFSDSLTKDKP